MAIDFEAFAITTDERIIGSTRAAGIQNPRRGVLGNRGEPDESNIPDHDEYGKPDLHDHFVKLNNADARLLFVRAFAVPALGFFAEWRSGASFCLTRWQFGPVDWARG